MSHKIFISLTHQDTKIAEALRDAIKEIFGELFVICFSTSNDLEEGIRGGADWYQWIVDQVIGCDIALVLITPNSAQKPWLMWESGAVYGAAVATGNNGINKVRPIIYRLRSVDIPSPIERANLQRYDGESKDDIQKLMWELLSAHGHEIPNNAMINATKKLGAAVDFYLQQTNDALLDTIALPTRNIMEEWHYRIDDMIKSNRISEIDELVEWMNISFGIQANNPQSLDLRIHARLGQIYMNAGKNKIGQAIVQLRLAQRMAPRDMYILRKLGKAYLDNNEMDNAADIIRRIEALDKNVTSINAECAALKGRWLLEKGKYSDAAKIFEEALAKNKDSYYLADRAAMAHLKNCDEDNAKVFFKKANNIIKNLTGEINIWTLATSTNACLALGKMDEARENLQKMLKQNLTTDNKQVVRKGISMIAESLSEKTDINQLLTLLD